MTGSEYPSKVSGYPAKSAGAIAEATRAIAEVKSLQVQRVAGLELPTFWVPANTRSSAGIIFRVGPGTEPMALRGITHLIEHVVGQAIGYQPHISTLSGGPDITMFSHSGDPVEVASFLSAVSWTLCSLPLDLVDGARNTVKHENEGRKLGPRDHILRLRHGYLGRGALGLYPYGINKSGHRRVISWASGNFRKSSAAIWIAGPMLEDLNIRLMGGPPVKTVHELLSVPTPGAAYDAPGALAISFVCSHSHAAFAAAQIAEERAYRELCEVRRISTYVTFEVESLDENQVEVVVTADCVRGQDDEVARVILSVLDAIAATPPTDEEIGAYTAAVRVAFGDPANAPALALESAVGHLTNRVPRPTADLLADARVLSGRLISATLAEAMKTLLIVVAEGSSIVTERFKFIGDWIPEMLPGAKIKPQKLPSETKVDRELVVGPNGVTLRFGKKISSVRFSECGLMLMVHKTGFRELISETGSRVAISPEAWQNGERAIALIDREIAADRRVVLDSEAEHSASGIDRRIRRH